MTNRIALTLLLGLAACTKGAEKSADSTKATGTTSVAPKGNGKKITIAMIAKSSTNPVFLAARTGADAAAKALSAKDSIEVTVNWLTPADENAEMQAQRIRQAVNDGADAVLISCSDAGKVTGAINDAVDRGVLVMTFDSDAPQSKRFAFYGVDDAKTGQQTMAEVATLLHDKGKVAILAGNQNAPNLQLRVKAAKEEAAKRGLTVVGVFNHPETAQDASAEVIRANNAYPDIQGWAMIGGWPLFARSLLTDATVARQKIVSVDALPVELAYVEKDVVPVLLAQSVYKWGEVGVTTIVEKLHDKKDPPSPIMEMQLVKVTKANLGEWARQLKAWGFTDIDEKYLKM